MIASARALPIPGNASSSSFEAELMSTITAAGIGAVTPGLGAVVPGVVEGDVACAETAPTPAKIIRVAIANTVESFMLGTSLLGRGPGTIHHADEHADECGREANECGS